MNVNNLAKSAVLGLAVLLASNAFASNKGSLHVGEAVEIGGQQLPAGDYQVRWNGTGPNVELSVMQGKKLVTKASAHVIDLKSAPSADAAVVDHRGSTPTVAEVRFAGKKQALAIDGAGSAKMEMNSNSSK
jgi:hypothetical protein